jgi:EAL domain-containing protein (putative c-di-GMP-specific phosphodiesterase class I)
MSASSADSALGGVLTALLAVVRRAGAVAVVDRVRKREQADWWRAAGADLATGDLFGAPRQPDGLLADVAEA